MRYLVIIFTLFATGAFAQSLKEYQQMAAENHPGLQAKYKVFEAAMERTTQVNTLPDPTFSFGYFISPVETRVGPQQAKLSLTQMFPWFGTLKLKGDVAALNAEAQYQTFLGEKNKLYYEVAAAYYPLYEVEKWVALEEANVSLLESFKRIATARFENGEGTLVDVLRVDIMLKESITNLDILKKKKQALAHAFNLLLNREENEKVLIIDSLKVDERIFTKDSLYNQNPVLDELDIRIEAAEKQTELSRKQGLPSLGVGLDYLIVGDRTDMTVEDNGKNALMPMISIGLPIFRSKYKSAQREAQLMKESYQLQKNNQINQLASGYEMAAFELEQQKELIHLYDAQATETQQALNLLMASYQNNGTDFEEVLRVQQQLLKYQKMKATALVKYHTSVAKLNYLTAKEY